MYRIAGWVAVGADFWAQAENVSNIDPFLLLVEAGRSGVLADQVREVLLEEPLRNHGLLEAGRREESQLPKVPGGPSVPAD